MTFDTFRNLVSTRNQAKGSGSSRKPYWLQPYRVLYSSFITSPAHLPLSLLRKKEITSSDTKNNPDWSGVASACSSLKRDFGSWPEIEVRSQQWEHQILATRPVVSDKSWNLWFYRKGFPQRQSSEASTHWRTQRGSPWVKALWWFELLLWGVSSRFPLASHHDCLVHSPNLVYLRVLLCVLIHLLAKLNFTEKASEQNIPWHDSPLASKEPFCTCVVGEVSWLLEQEICCLSRAQSRSLIALLFLEFQSTENESPVALPWRDPSASCLRTMCGGLF